MFQEQLPWAGSADIVRSVGKLRRGRKGKREEGGREAGGGSTSGSISLSWGVRELG